MTLVSTMRLHGAFLELLCCVPAGQIIGPSGVSGMMQRDLAVVSEIDARMSIKIYSWAKNFGAYERLAQGRSSQDISGFEAVNYLAIDLALDRPEIDDELEDDYIRFGELCAVAALHTVPTRFRGSTAWNLDFVAADFNEEQLPPQQPRKQFRDLVIPELLTGHLIVEASRLARPYSQWFKPGFAVNSGVNPIYF